MEAKLRRQQAMEGARRTLVLEAAKRVVAQVGIEKASVREVAKDAGYTPGALYSYFGSKAELLSALLADVFVRVQQAAQAVRVPKGRSTDAFAARVSAWFAFFLANPRDLELVLHLLGKRGGGQSSAELEAQAKAGLLQSVAPLAEALAESGGSAGRVAMEMDALLAYGLGLLLLHPAQPSASADAALQMALSAYIDTLLVRVRGDATDMPGAASAPETLQVDLFA